MLIKGSLWTLCIASLLWARFASAQPSKLECIAANEDGQDLRRTGKLRDAIQRFEVCTVPDCPAPVRTDCLRQNDELRKALPTRRLVVVNGKGRVLKAEVSVDGTAISNQQTVSETELDPGEHQIRATLRGYRPGSKRIVIAEGTHGEETVTLDELESTVGRSVRFDEATKTSAIGLESQTQRPLAYALAAGGLAGAAVGITFGVLSKVTYDDALSKCSNRNPSSCSQEGLDCSARAHDQATVSTVAFVIGAVLAAGGVILFTTLPKSDARKSSIRQLAAALGPGASW